MYKTIQKVIPYGAGCLTETHPVIKIGAAARHGSNSVCVEDKLRFSYEKASNDR